MFATFSFLFSPFFLWPSGLLSFDGFNTTLPFWNTSTNVCESSLPPLMSDAASYIRLTEWEGEGSRADKHGDKRKTDFFKKPEPLPQLLPRSSHTKNIRLVIIRRSDSSKWFFKICYKLSVSESYHNCFLVSEPSCPQKTSSRQYYQ